MPIPLIIAAGAAASGGGLSATMVTALVTTAAGIGSGIGYGVSLLFGKNNKNNPQPEKTPDKQKTYIEKREAQREQRERSGMEKANHAKTVLKKTQKKTLTPCKSVHKASEKTAKACEKIENATINTLDANRFFSQELPKIKQNTQNVQHENAQLLREIERLNTLLDEKVKTLDKVNLKAGKLKNTVMAQTEDIRELKISLEAFKQKINAQDKTIETMDAALYRAAQKISFLKEALEKYTADFEEPSQKKSFV